MKGSEIAIPVQILCGRPSRGQRPRKVSPTRSRIATSTGLRTRKGSDGSAPTPEFI
jgi:hypothetical protein